MKGGDDDDDAASVTSSQAPSQLPTSSQATPRQPRRDRRAPRAASGGKRVDDAIVKLVDVLTQNTGVQDRLQSTVQEAARPRVAFCQWMGLDMANLEQHL